MSKTFLKEVNILIYNSRYLNILMEKKDAKGNVYTVQFNYHPNSLNIFSGIMLSLFHCQYIFQHIWKKIMTTEFFVCDCFFIFTVMTLSGFRIQLISEGIIKLRVNTDVAVYIDV